MNFLVYFLILDSKLLPPHTFMELNWFYYWVFESLLSQISLKHPVLDGDVNFTDREIMFPSQRQNYPGDRVATCDTCDIPGPEEHHQWPGADISWWHQRPGWPQAAVIKCQLLSYLWRLWTTESRSLVWRGVSYLNYTWEQFKKQQIKVQMIFYSAVSLEQSRLVWVTAQYMSPLTCRAWDSPSYKQIIQCDNNQYLMLMLISSPHQWCQVMWRMSSHHHTGIRMS